MEKVCSRCKIFKDVNEFYKRKDTKDGLYYHCKSCMKQTSKQYRCDHKGELKKKNKQYRLNNPEKIRNCSLNYFYNVSLEERNKLLASQNNCCAICKSINSGKKDWCVDHDHVTNKIRGILCCSCNPLLGYAKDSIIILQNAIEYLKLYDSI